MKQFDRIGRATAIVLAVAFAFTHAASAGLLDNGTTTLNTDTGLEYLDLSFTNNSFPGSYLVGGFPPGRPVPAGFRPGTSAEAMALFAEVGLVSEDPFSSAAFAPVDFLLGFIGGLTVSPLSGRTDTQTNIATSTPNGVSGQVVGYQLKTLDFDHPSSTDYGVFIREDAALAGASNTLGTLHVRNKPNATPGAGLAPSSSGASGQSFNGIAGDGVWVVADTPSSGMLKLTGTAGNLIRAVGIAETFADADGQVTITDPTLGEIVLMPGDVHTLSTPVMMLTIHGIDPPALAPGVAGETLGDPTLPLFVAFDTGSGDLLVTDVPEPASVALLAAGALVLRRRR